MVLNVVKRSMVLVLASCALVSAPSLRVAHAGDADSAQGATGLAVSGQAATDFVKKKHDELQSAMKAAKDPKTDPKLLAIFDTMLDYDAISRDSLDGEWDALNEEQRAAFSGLLKQLVQKSYRKNLRDPSAYAVQYTSTEESARGVVVKTLAQNTANKREKALGIHYLVASTASGPRIRDVVTDDVSLVGNYRSQFKRMLKKRGFEGLLEQMRKQLEK